MRKILTHEYSLKSAFILILGIALGLGGPYGTFEFLPLIPRLGYWTLALFIPWVIWESLFTIVSKYIPETLNLRILMALIMPAFAVIGSAFVTVLGLQFGYLKVGTFLQTWPISIVHWLVFSFVVILPLILIGDELSHRQRKSGGSDLLKFLTEKLPKKLRGANLIALKSEDHYLRVYTTAGDDLILMSMADAITALSGYPGVRTHRSWWVALDQLQQINDKKKLPSEIQLSSGIKVPISRRKTKFVVSALRENSSKSM